MDGGYEGLYSLGETEAIGEVDVKLYMVLSLHY